jgi:pimeloyl-ACP methyl ester carboxylesterase
MATIVLIAGSGHGGWYFDEVVPGLKELGHTVYAPTLTGMDRENPVSTVINLDTHIDDVVALVESENLTDVVLVGHSYAGMVITGAAERLRGKVRGLLYFDAMVPEPGKRLWDALSTEMQDLFLSVSFDGYRVFPDPAFQEMRPRVVPHPLPTYLQPVHYEPSALDVEIKVYVLAAENNPSPFHEIAKRLEGQDDWTVISTPYGHDMFVDGPERMLEIIADAVA